MAPGASGAAAAPSLDRLAETAPGLSRLLAERQALEQQMAALTGGDPADPRYAVEPLDRRRAALNAWGAGRDAARASRRSPDAAFAAVAPPLGPPPLRATAAEQLRGTSADQFRSTPGELPAALRPTAPANDDPPLRALERLIERAPASRRERSDRASDDPPLGEAGRRLGEAGRALADLGRAAAARPDAAEPARPRSSADPLDRRLARARDMAGRARRIAQASERALDGARDAIPNDWQERARERIPGLGRADTYVRETLRKLQVAVGTVDEIGQKADRLRSLARDMRELKEADEANDEARRERAIERLKARRQED
jgi:hypothetical protein